MASVVPKNPRPMLQELVNEKVIIKLKWGETEYHGKLVSVDSYMNMQLSDAVEIVDEQQKGENLGNILVRCNNVLWISGADAAQNGDTKMSS